MSRSYRALYTYAWDLADEGLEVALGRIRPTGINTITLAASYHAGKFVRPHGVGGKVYFPADGTVYFQARPERYGQIKPLINPLVAEFDALAELEKQAPDLDRVAWVVCCHNTPLGQLHPDFTARNAFGDPYPYSLCPAHPAVRDYVVNLCSDLADRYDLAGLALETPGWLPYDHGFHHEFALLPLDRFAKTLLALCFAESTRHAAHAAGIDADRLQAKTRALLERWFAADLAVPDQLATEWWLAEIVSDPEFALFPALALPGGFRPRGRGQGGSAGDHAPRRDPDRAAPAGRLLARGQRFFPVGRGRRRARGARLPAERRRGLSQRLARPRARRRDSDPELHPAPQLSRPRQRRRDGRGRASPERGRHGRDCLLQLRPSAPEEPGPRCRRPGCHRIGQREDVPAPDS